MLSLVYTFSARNIRLALFALHGGLEALHCSSDEPNPGPGGSLLGKSEGHGDSGYDLGSVVTGPSDPREIAAYEAGRGGVLFLVIREKQ